MQVNNKNEIPGNEITSTVTEKDENIYYIY
jgi:hypothetical protein